MNGPLKTIKGKSLVLGGALNVTGRIASFRGLPRFAPKVSAGPAMVVGSGAVSALEGAFADPGRHHRCLWTFGDGASQSMADCTTPATSHAYAPGIWHPLLRVTSRDGRWAEAATTVTVSPAR